MIAVAVQGSSLLLREGLLFPPSNVKLPFKHTSAVRPSLTPIQSNKMTAFGNIGLFKQRPKRRREADVQLEATE